ncbi:MAG: ParA family protein, partial [Vogesella sp.]|uniref:ParA family protein n=1 Tax=Vogesella sp. TaxID=1904252 RepID=UPI003F2B52EF
MAQILAVSNRKGGSGKTASAVNMAANLAATGKRVLLIDLDTQGHCALGLGVATGRSAPSVHDLFSKGAPLRPALQATSWPGLCLLPANPLFAHGSGSHDELLLHYALQQEGFCDEFDIIVLDTPPSLDVLLLNALYAAQWVLVPFVPHFLAGEGVRQLARTLFRIASSGNHLGLHLLGLLPVMYDQRVGMHRRTLSDMAQQFGALRMLPAIRNDIRLAESFAAGQPLGVYA